MSTIRLFRDTFRKGEKEAALNSILQLSQSGRNVIGFDLGHGESAAARLDRNGDQYSVKALELDNIGHKKMPTKLFIHQDDPSLDRIGASVIETELSTQGDCYIQFKAHPDYAGEYIMGNGVHTPPRTKGEVMNTFVRVFCQHLSIENLVALNRLEKDQPSIVLIGRPAGAEWASAEKEYCQLLQKDVSLLGRPVEQVFVVSESLAALAYSIATNAKEFKSSVRAGDTVICIDMGSSTADITVMKDGRNVLEFSIPLGASIIDHNILQYILETNHRQLSKDALMKNSVSAMDDCRSAKERYFGEVGTPAQPSAHCAIMLTEQDDSPSFLNAIINKAFMDHVLCGMPVAYFANGREEQKPSWQAACRDFYAYVAKEIDKKGFGPVKKVIMTGGASNMPFTGELAAACFGQATVEASHEPSYTVAKGLVAIALYAAQTEKAMLALPGKLEAILASYLYHEDDLCNELAAKIAENVHIIFENEIISWVISGDKRSLNDVIEKKIIPKANAWLTGREAAAERIDLVKTVVKKWLSTMDKAGLRLAVQNMLAASYGVKLSRFEEIVIPDNVYASVGDVLRQINLDVNKDNCLRTALATRFQYIFGGIQRAVGYDFMKNTDHDKEWRTNQYGYAMGYKDSTLQTWKTDYAAQLKAKKLLQRIRDQIHKNLLDNIERQIDDMELQVFCHQAAETDN